MPTQRPKTSQSMLMRNNTGDTSNLSQEPTPHQNYTAPIGNGYIPVETLSDEATYSLVAEKTRTASRDSPLSLPDHLYTIWLDRWTTEILSCILSLAALAGLVLTLRFLDGHVVTEVPLTVSVNAVVAVFATVIKTSLLLPVAECLSQLKWLWYARARPLLDFDKFDMASRGPWGSLLLVFRLQSRHLAALGAWITVLAVAIDPFTQQVVRSVICHRTLPYASASVPRAYNFTTEFLPNPDLEVAVYAGLIGIPNAIDFRCTTGNCTFPTDSLSGGSYQTLAMESACIDVSGEIEEYYIHEQGQTEWRLPVFDNETQVIGGHYLAWTKSNNSNPFFPESWNGNYQGAGLLSFTALLAATDWDCYGQRGFLPECYTPLAVECKLWPALQTIGARINISFLEESVLSSEPVPATTLDDGSILGWVTIASKVLRRGIWEPCTASDSYTLHTPVPVYNNSLWYGASDNVTLQWYTQDCIWALDSHARFAFRALLASIFAEKSVLAPSSVAIEGDLWLKNLFRNDTVDVSMMEKYVGQLARAMTVYMRNWSSAKDETHGLVHGDAIKTETCIQVRWPWFSFPASLVAFTLLLLAMTIWKTRKNKRPLRQTGTWKSSSLAVLFGGLDDQVRSKSGPMEKKSQMEDCAKKLNVSLIPAENGWRLG